MSYCVLNNDFIIRELSDLSFNMYNNKTPSSVMFYCDTCKKEYTKANKHSHLRSKYHYYQIHGKKCEICDIDIDKTTGSHIKLCIDCYKKSSNARFINHYCKYQSS